MPEKIIASAHGQTDEKKNRIIDNKRCVYKATLRKKRKKGRKENRNDFEN